MSTESITLTLAIGVALSMIWERRTGCSSGGLIAPGVLALSLYSPSRVAVGVAIAFAVWGLLALLSRRIYLYGRMRVGAAMLAALALRAVTGELSPDPFWFGWVVPGLIAADMQRQGAFRTLASLAACSFAALFAFDCIAYFAGILR